MGGAGRQPQQAAVLDETHSCEAAAAGWFRTFSPSSLLTYADASARQAAMKRRRSGRHSYKAAAAIANSCFQDYFSSRSTGDRNDPGCRPRTGADLRSELPGLHEGIHRSKRRRRRVERLHVQIAGAVRGYRVGPPGNMHGKSVLRVRRHEASSPESAAGLLSTAARYAWTGCDGREAGAAIRPLPCAFHRSA